MPKLSLWTTSGSETRIARWVIVAEAIIVLIPVGGMIWALNKGDVGVAVATFVLAQATILLAVVAFNEMQEGRKRAQETQEQIDETKRASLRPLLIPLKLVGERQEPDVARFWSEVYTTVLESGTYAPVVHGHVIEIMNVGSGVATDVCGVILPPVELKPNTSAVYSMRVSHPIAQGQDFRGDFERGAILILSANQIATVSLFAAGHPHYLLRLTLTYCDALGLKHASIFDLTARLVWEQVRILNEISQDLRDIDADNQPKIAD